MLEHHGHYDEAHIQRQLRHGNFKYVAHLDDSDELYDIVQDPFELDNVAAHHDYADIIADLKRRLKLLMAAHQDDAPELKRLRQQLE